MSFANGRPQISIPGPSIIPDRVLQAMHRPAPNIYDGALIEMTHSLIPDLRRVACTDGDVAIYISNGHGAWEAALANVLAPGDKALATATGRFGNGWAEMAEGLGAEVTLLDFGNDVGIDLDLLETRLRADTAREFKAVLLTHVDTSTSRKNDVAAVRAVLEAAGHPALLMVDCIASLGCDRFEMDAWGADVMVAACQKGLMVPPGLGFVFFNDRARAVQERMERVSSYWNWTPRAKPEIYYQYFGGTAPTHHLFGLREALNMIHEEGMEAIWARHDALARAIWAASHVWETEGDFRLNVREPEARSAAVTAARLSGNDGTRLRDWVEDNAGLTLGIGLGMAPHGSPKGDAFFRLGHMGHVNATMIMGMLGAMDAGMSALGIPHGTGALEAAANSLAKSGGTGV